ncbi:MAG: hypothetical protein WD825_10125 [Gemmatimonadaceae bacterium]
MIQLVLGGASGAGQCSAALRAGNSRLAPDATSTAPKARRVPTSRRAAATAEHGVRDNQ